MNRRKSLGFIGYTASAAAGVVLAPTALQMGGTLDLSQQISDQKPSALADVLADLARKNPDIILHEIAGQSLFPFYGTTGGLSAKCGFVFYKNAFLLNIAGWDGEFDFPRSQGYTVKKFAPGTGYVAFTWDKSLQMSGPSSIYINILDGIEALKKV